VRRVKAADMGREKTLDEEISDLEAQQTVADDLAELKAKMAKSKTSDKK